MGEYVLTNIDITLDSESIGRAIATIESFESDLKYALDKVVDEFLNLGKGIASMKLKKYLTSDNADLRSGALLASIRVEMKNGETGTGYICAGYPGDHGKEKHTDMSYAVFFEFGTGVASYYKKENQGGGLIKGEASVERHLEHGYYDASRTSGRTKNHPTGRDVYKSHDDAKIMSTPQRGEFYGWVYKDGSGHYRITQGQSPKPFMYDTLMWLTNEAESRGGYLVYKYLTTKGE